MAGRLDDMLQPGERVLFRAGPDLAWAARRWVWLTVLFAVPAAAFVWVSDSWWLLILALQIPIAALVVVPPNARMAVAVTERRILCMRDKDNVEEIPLRGIARIEVGPGGVTLRSAIERRIPLPDLPDPDGLAAAVAAATGLAMPETVSPRHRRLAMWAGRLPFSCAILALPLPAVLHDWLNPTFDGDYFLAVLFLALVGVPAIGFVAGLLAATALLRLNLTAAETHGIFGPSGAQQGASYLQMSATWSRVTRRLVSLLYGERI